MLDIPWTGGGRNLQWHPKGGAITFRRNADGASNVYSLPIKGGLPVQITKFKKGLIDSYDWAADGKLVMSRGETKSDVVLISNYRSEK